MKVHSRFTRAPAHVPPARTPFQDYVATQRRMAWVERLGKFVVGLFFLALLLGQLGNGA